MNRRKREQLLAKRRRHQLRSQTKPAPSKPVKASKYLYHLDEFHRRHPDMVAVIYCRVSARSQDHRENLQNQESVLRQQHKTRGIPLVGCYLEVGSGSILDEKREGLRKAIQAAKQHVNAVIVTTSTDRFLRNRCFTTDRLDTMPNEEEFEELNRRADSVPLATYLHPDMPPKEVRGYQSKWGQRTKGNKGGPPLKKSPGYKKRRRLRNLPRVLRLQKGGKNPSQIAVRTGIARSTVCDWIVKYGR